MFKKIILPLLLLLSTNCYSEVYSNDLKAAYIYQISKGINIDSMYYCINGEAVSDGLKQISESHGIIVTDNMNECQVTFNSILLKSITFTDNEDNKQEYMFLLKRENDKLVIYRNLNKTKNIRIPNHLYKLMKEY